MFTGLITGRGKLVEARNHGAEEDIVVDLGSIAATVSVGDSIALSGVCCTATRVDGTTVTFRLSAETLRRTWFGGLQPGESFNVETALRVGDPLGGHLVQGHVDAVGAIVQPIDPIAGGDLVVRIPAALDRYCVEKGSLTVDGVSLTIAGIRDLEATIAVIPHTAQVTTLGRRASGAPVNLEVDVIAKYVERILAARQ